MPNQVKPLVHLVHGFNVWDGGKQSVGLLEHFFLAENYFTTIVNYGWIGLGGVALKNPKVSKKLCNIVKVGDIGIGHSNGCAILHQAACDGAPFKKLIFINPALDSTATLPADSTVEEIHVWHSPSDGPVRLWRGVEKYVPFVQSVMHHPWGAMGAYGYEGEDSRYVNFNKEENYEMVSKAHSDMFEWDKVGYFGREIVKMLREPQFGEADE